MDPLVTPLSVFAAFLAIAGVAAYVKHVREKKRSAALAELAADLSFEFSAFDQPDLRAALAGFHLFSQGHSKKLWNLMRGVADDLAIAIFDYRFVVGRGKHRQTFVQSVFCAQRAGMDLPTFCMRPASIWHKIGKWFGNDDIAFDSHPGFAKTYLVRGLSEIKIRELFTADVLTHFEATKGLNVEGDGDTMIYYSYNRAQPEKVRPFMAEGFEILKLIVPPDASGSQSAAS